MKKSFIVANWKSNKTILEAEEWFRIFNNLQLTIDKKVIVCPSFTLLPFVKESIVKSQLPIAVGAQDISPFDEGAYTGEVNGKQIRMKILKAEVGPSASGEKLKLLEVQYEGKKSQTYALL